MAGVGLRKWTASEAAAREFPPDCDVPRHACTEEQIVSGCAGLVDADGGVRPGDQHAQLGWEFGHGGSLRCLLEIRRQQAAQENNQRPADAGGEAGERHQLHPFRG